MLKRWIETTILVIGTLGFWGFVYPELTLTEDTYIEEEADVREGTGELRIKSRALEYILAEDKRVGAGRVSNRKKEKPKG